MIRDDAVVSGRGSDDPAVVFVSNEIVRIAVTAASDVSTGFLRETRDTVTNVLTQTLAEQHLDQFVAEFHDSDQGRLGLIILDVTYDGNREMEEAPVAALQQSIPSFNRNQDIELLAWPVVDGMDEFERVSDIGRRIGTFGAHEIAVTLGVRIS